MTKFSCGLLLFLAAWNSSAATYVFRGEIYTSVNGPNYTENMSIRGFIEFNQELEPNSSINTDDIIDFGFNDGVQTLDQSNSLIYFTVFSTNDIGMPFIYRVKVVKTPTTNVEGVILSGMNLNFTINTEGFERSEAGFTGPCLLSGTTVCDFGDISMDSGSYSSPSLGGAPLPNWTLLRGVIQQVPMNSAWTMSLMIFFILLVGILNHKYHRKND